MVDISRQNKIRDTEDRFPHFVEIEIPERGLDIRLNQEIVKFHRARKIEMRLGLRRRSDNRSYCRWCFSEAAVADEFREAFGDRLSPR